MHELYVKEAEDAGELRLENPEDLVVQPLRIQLIHADNLAKI